ncbi:MAG: phage virion morphogenesis protein [Caulobacteraceae bacterium]
MSGAALTITLDKVGPSALIERLLTRLAHKSPLMARLATYLENSTRHRFETSVGADSKQWVPSIRAQLKGGKTLVDHGLLRDSFHGAHTDDTASVGTNDKRAPLLHFGGVIRAKSAGSLHMNIPGVGFRRPAQVTIPGRPILGVTGEDRQEIGAIIGDYLREAGA